jgi:hypothetical protein
VGLTKKFASGKSRVVFKMLSLFSFLFSLQLHNVFSISSIKRIKRLDLKASLILGVNKYSHDTSCCFIDTKTNQIVFSQSKERITGKKHDGGDIGSLVKHGLEAIGADINDIKLVVSNNHHFRVLPFEQRIPTYTALNYVPESYNDEYNLLPNAEHLELSHHLAHAWSVVSTAPFDEGFFSICYTVYLLFSFVIVFHFHFHYNIYLFLVISFFSFLLYYCLFIICFIYSFYLFLFCL